MRACFSASPHSCKHICFSSQPGEGFSEGGEEFCVGVVHHEVAVAFEALHVHPADFNASFPVGDGDASPEGELMAWGQAHGAEEIVDLQDFHMDFILGIVCLFHDQALTHGVCSIAGLIEVLLIDHPIVVFQEMPPLKHEFQKVKFVLREPV